MSKFVRVQTELRDINFIKRALNDLKIGYKENSRYVHVWSGFAGTVPLVIQHRRLNFALRTVPAADGTDSYEVIGDDMQMGEIRKLLAQVQQRYAYHKVLDETQKAGFALVEESTGRDKVIRLTVRRWE
jgi:hypothetical protein